MMGEGQNSRSTLWDLSLYQTAVIQSDQIKNPVIMKRLNELGFSIGSKVTCVEKIPFGGPKCFLTHRGEFALDKEVSENILVNIVGEQNPWK